jgi:hypothetical protein
MEIYRTIFETWRSQVDSYWQRSNYFAVFETAALAGCWYLMECKHWCMGLFSAILGILLTVIWLLNNSKVHTYVLHWWDSIKVIEGHLSLEDQQFDFARQLDRKPRGCVNRIPYSCLVQFVPGLFMIAWIGLLGYGFAWRSGAHAEARTGLSAPLR